jgi:hypothetical protein
MTGPSIPTSGAALSLNGATYRLRSVDGGAIGADLVIDERGARLGPVRYEDLVLVVGAQPEAKTLREWITTSCGGSAEPTDCEVLSGNNAKIEAVRRVRNGVLSSIDFPTFDATSRVAGGLTLHITPETIDVLPATGSMPAGSREPAWTVDRFRLDIDGLDCSGVTHIDPITVTTPVPAFELIGGDRRDAGPNPTTLKVQIRGVAADTWIDWHRSFVIDGQNGASDRRSGRITLLGADLKRELAVIDLGGLGISSLAWPKVPDAINTATFTADLFSEAITISWPV